MKKYWLLKSEPDAFSIDHLHEAEMQTTSWDGVRNYQARNFMKNGMEVGDLALFYHSNTKVPGIVGLAEICSDSYVDHTAFDPKAKYFDAKSDIENPRWFMVNVKFKQKFDNIISLSELKNYPELESMLILRKGNRLSITPVSKNEFDFIMSLT